MMYRNFSGAICISFLGSFRKAWYDSAKSSVGLVMAYLETKLSERAALSTCSSNRSFSPVRLSTPSAA
ncbi:hypothetical protein D3C87_2114610 [compost metagenome]